MVLLKDKQIGVFVGMTKPGFNCVRESASSPRNFEPATLQHLSPTSTFLMRSLLLPLLALATTSVSAQGDHAQVVEEASNQSESLAHSFTVRLPAHLPPTSVNLTPVL